MCECESEHDMENKNENTLVQLDGFESVTVCVMTVSPYIKPYQYDYKYEGDTKFTEAFKQVVATGAFRYQVINLFTQNKNSSHKVEVTAAEFVKYLAIEMLRNSLSAFTKRVNMHSKGFNLEKAYTEEQVTDAEVNEVLNAYEDGSRYWKHIIVQQTEIENAKKKSVEHIDDFGSGNPTV